MASASPGGSKISSPSNSPRRAKGEKMNKSLSEKKGGDDSPLPGINERLGYLRPSRELLEYYRKKIAEYDEEHESLVSKLEEYRVTYEEQHKLQWELRQREEEIVELQKALSDMQIYLFQEREHVLRLYSENDRLKIRELEDKKKIQQLLALSGTPDSEITYFHKEPPAKAVVEQKAPKRPQSSTLANKTLSGTPDSEITYFHKEPPAKAVVEHKAPKRPQSSTLPNKKDTRKQQGRRSPSPLRMSADQKYDHDNQALSLQVESLQAQIQEQAKLAKEQVQALVEDRRVKEEEMETRRQRDEAKIHTLTEKLHKTQDLLYESTKDFLELRYQGRANERQWMAEKDKLLREMDQCKSQLCTTVKDSTLDTSNMYDNRSSYIEEIKSLEYQLQQSQKLSEMYREQVIQLEDELSRIREEGDVTREIFKDRGEKMSKRLKLMNTRYQDLERRRNLEVEGFKTDIKNLRTRLKEVERQLYKVTIGFSEDMDVKRPDDLDMQILRNIRATSGRSKKMVGELKNLKAKMYGIENDLKHL